MRFNPPPNWPPKGWSPPSDWKPEPSWPDPPAGWKLFVPDDQRPPRGKGVVIASAVAALAIIALVVVLVMDFSKDSGASDDEDQIRGVLATVTEAWNAPDFAKFKSVSCKKDQDAKSFTEDNFKKAVDKAGKVEITIESIKVTGDTAVANIERKYSKSSQSQADDSNLVKEGGSWKLCSGGP